MPDELDFDALLQKATGASGEKKKEAPEVLDLDHFGERAEGFKFDPRDGGFQGTDPWRQDGSSITVDPKDFRNRVNEQEKNKKTKTLRISFLGFLFLVILGVTMWFIVPRGEVAPPTDQTTVARFEAILPDAPQVSSTSLMIPEVTENGLAAGAYELVFPGMEFITTDYKATAPSDYGLAATATVSGPWEGTQVYIFKDMVRSKAFSNAWEGQTLEVQGASAAAVMFMDFPEGTRAVVAMVAPDSSGFMVVLPENLNWETAANLENFLRIDKA